MQALRGGCPKWRTNPGEAACRGGLRSSRALAVGASLSIGHLACAVDAHDSAPLLCVEEEEHPSAVGDSEHQQIVSVAALGVSVGEALLRLDGGDVVVVQQLVLVVLVPFELGSEATLPASTVRSHEKAGSPEVAGRLRSQSDARHLCSISEGYTEKGNACEWLPPRGAVGALNACEPGC